MNIFVAGASGTLGQVLVPQLVEAGYVVTALSRSPEKLEALKQMGATPVLGDVFDRPHLKQLMAAAAPDVVIHQLTRLGASAKDPFVETNRLRTEGTANLIDAAQSVRAQRFIAQSVAFLCQSIQDELTNEETPLYLDALPPLRSIVEAIADLEHQVLSLQGMTGVVLRYGHFYGPGTYYAAGGAIAQTVRQGQYPIIESGRGTYSFIQIEDAAAATVQAVSKGARGIYTIVDDRPVPFQDWVPGYARLLQAPAPEVISAAAARTQLDPLRYFLALQQGSINHKARHALGWQPRYPNWYEGFRAMLTA